MNVHEGMLDFIDTHAHIYLDRFDEDRDEMIQRAKEAGVRRIVMPAIDVPSIERALDLAARHEGLYTMAALHPSETGKSTDEDFERVVSFCDHPNVVAVGESGLDYYWDRSFDDRQIDFFKRHIHLAIEKDLPLILHTRESWQDVVRILQEEKSKSGQPERLRGIFHCYSGPEELALAALDLGFLLGLGGTLTFKNSKVEDTLKNVPLDRIVLETDAPFLAPHPMRGKRNESAFVPLVAEKLAETYTLSLATIAETTTRNAESIFRIGSTY